MPRRDACWPPRCWAGMTSVSGLCPLCRGQRGQAGSRGRGIAGKHVHQPKLRRGDRRLDDPRYLDLPLGLPISADACAAGSAGRRLSRTAGQPDAGRAFHSAGGGSRAALRVGTGGGRAGRRDFSRDLQVLGEGPKPFWMAAADASTSPALDVADVPAEFTFRAQEAREQDGYDQVVQWTAWLLRSNPDTLAAHFHPMLCAAVNVINVRGLGPLLQRWARPAGRRADPCTRPWRWPRRRR